MRLVGAVIFGLTALLLGGPTVAAAAVTILPILIQWVRFAGASKS